MKKILVTGAKGQLGSELAVFSKIYIQFEWIFTDRGELDLCNLVDLEINLATISPQFIINCAAHTAVDRAETEMELSDVLNHQAVAVIAKWSQANDCKLIHVSTDYVFDGTMATALTETALTNPINVYGLTKLKGENVCLQENPNSIIIRTSWVYSSFGNNFVKTMSRLMQERDSLNVVNDQIGSPTYAADLAQAFMTIITHLHWQAGIYNFSNEGAISWYEFALAIQEIGGFECEISGIPSSHYPTPAKRPQYSLLDKSKIKDTFGVVVPEYKESLNACMKLLVNNEKCVIPYLILKRKDKLLLKNKIKMKKILITGGAGFIGSHVVRLFVKKYSQYQIFNLDALTYAGNLENITDIEAAPNYTFIKGDIVDAVFIDTLFAEHQFDGVLHLAAESHVDRSITDPLSFVKTNVIGTMNLLNAAKATWQGNYEGKRFYHISTDEVYGSLGAEGLFTETTAYDPNSPYSASKASSDHFVRAYGETYGLPYVLTNCSNNYGPFHFPEKLIPLFINNIIQNKPLPVYGDGKYTRDWLFVEDHAVAIDLVFHEGTTYDTYNIGGFNEWQNIDLVKLLCKIMDEKLGRVSGTSEQLISYVKDRPGHDLRYAIDATKINKELGWKPSVTFEQGLERTVNWYLENQTWLNNITSGAYASYYEKQYS